jgi:ABC-type uncharacterized transport system auxiliary subunit
MNTPIQSPQNRRTPLCAAIGLLPLWAALGFILTGCLSRPALERKTFALQSPPAGKSAAAKGKGLLVVRSVDVSPLFESRALVYRTGPETYEVDAYAGFLIAPNQALAIPIRAWLGNSGAFEDVLEPGSLLKGDKELQVHVGELYGDFRKSDQPASVLSLRMVFLDAGSMGKVFLQKDYSRSVPLKQKTAAAVVAGYDEALTSIMTEVAADLAGQNR